MRERHAIHVVLRDGYGRYLAGQKSSWAFTDDFAAARVFDFVTDRIAEQVEVLRRNYGLELSIIAVDPLDRYEICDVCGHHAMAYSTFFDGHRYFCPDCRPHAVSAEGPERPAELSTPAKEAAPAVEKEGGSSNAAPRLSP
jgi:hypothetical protein